ncbi:zinc-binding protein A33-like isoform X1 [Rhincodon typus]|uniref:zinc-binding protein A33-like isoform X1 n=1 Tax=Rhincodon typus TaxID=259920 RepID=UPI00202DF0E9|nr:zinc-binding protein A33-like isoform X1 [Rhincodon typus]
MSAQLMDMPHSQQEMLQTLLNPLQKKKTEYSTSKRTYERRLACIKQQINEAEQHVKKEFDKLHQFLYREEKTALQKLKQERKRKSQLVKRKIDKITEEIAALSFTIQEIQQLLGEEDHIQILRRYPEVEKIYRIKGPTPIPVKAGPIVNVGKAIGSLQYRVWKKMLTVITTAPVTLDPCTAHPYLLLSEEFTSVRHTTKRQQSLSDSPERFDPCLCILGREGFTSGKHHWEVMVGQKTEWDLGVVRESINRKEAIDLNPDTGGWIIALRNGYQYRAATKTWKHLDLREKPTKIRVSLDYEGGKVTFYNAESKTHIYTFTATFTEKLYPFFSPGHNDGGRNAEPLKICPRTIIIQEE